MAEMRDLLLTKSLKMNIQIVLPILILKLGLAKDTEKSEKMWVI
jgi:hypothetical protein